MSSHQSNTHQSILWCTSWWNNRINKYTLVKCQLSHFECLVRITNIKWNDRTFSITDFKTGLTETIQSIICNLPQILTTFGLTLKDMKCSTCSSCCSRSITCREYI